MIDSTTSLRSSHSGKKRNVVIVSLEGQGSENEGK